jgi:hypothetical protein
MTKNAKEAKEDATDSAAAGASQTGAVAAWFASHLPAWFTGPAEIEVDHDEILVVGSLSPPEYPDGADDTARAAAEGTRIGAFREETRQQRMRIADEAERRFDRKVSWGAACGGRRDLFTTVSMPVMTRLRLPERKVLDTLVAAGVARSRSEALAWSVRLVGQHEGDWLADLREALVHVQKVRAEGPTRI